MPLSLDTIQVQPSNSGSFTGASGAATLPIGTTATSTVLICISSTSALMTSTGFTADNGAQASNVRTYLLRKSNVGAGETSWTLTASAGTFTRWTVYELAGLDLVAPVDVKMTSNTNTGSGTTASTGTLPRSTTYDGLLVALHASRNTTSTTAPTFSAHTNGFIEMDEGDANDGTGSVGLSISMKTVEVLDTFECTATCSATLTSTNPAGASIVCYAAEGAKREPNVAHFWGFFPGVSSTPAGLGTGNAGFRYFETVVGVPAITVDGLQLTGAASAQSVAAASITTALQAVKAHVGRIRFRLDSLSGDLELGTLTDSGGASTVVRYVSASQKIGVKVGTGTEQLSDATVTTGVLYNLDVRAMGTTTARTVDWQLDYGAGPVVQTQATFTAGAVLGSLVPVLGWSAAQTGTVTYAYALFSIIAGHYPLGASDWTMVLLKVDPAGTVTVSGSTSNFGVMTANGTIGAWDATGARNAVDEWPPTVGASADGAVAVTASATDYIEFPLETYQAAPTGSIRAARVLLPMWAASATAATCRVLGFDGTTAATLFAEADPTTDNTSTPGWVCAMWRPSGGWTQAKLDAAAVRFGSNDATPDIGPHAVGMEVAVQTTQAQAMFGTSGDVTVSASYDAVTGGVSGLATTTPADKGASLHYEVNASPTDVVVPVASSDTQVLDAPDHPATNYVALYPDPEPGSVT
jgi:hypothetical protein